MPAPLPYSCTFPESAGPFQFFSSGHTTKQPTMHKHSALCALGPDATRPATPPAWPTRTRVVASRFGGERAGAAAKASQNRTVCLRRLLSIQISSVLAFDDAPRGCVPPLLFARTWGLDPGRPGVPPPVLPLPASMSWWISVLIFCCHILPCPAKLKGSRVTHAQKLLLVPSPISLSPKTSFCLFQKK